MSPREFVLRAVSSISLAVSCQAFAQTAVPDDQEPAEIVVTAQRRPERPEDVPISLTALSGDQLEEMQATDMASLGKVVPSLVMIRTGAFTQPYLRGIGKRSTLGVENSVATYVDGVYLASSISALLDLRGIGRIEILNGPQGTLFGRNATGGVIQVITRNPSPDSLGETQLHIGSYGYIRGDAYLTGGSDRVAGNLAVSLSRNDGYGANLFTGKTDQGEVNHSLVARTKWLWRPEDAVKLTLAADYQDVDQDFSQRPVKGFPPIGGPRVVSFRDGDQDASNRFHFRYGGASVRAEAEIGSVNLMSLTAARRMYARYANELDLGPLPLLAGIPTARQKQFSQELQLQSKAASPARWIAGLYYLQVDEQYDPTIFRYGGSYSAGLGGRLQQTLFGTGEVSAYAAYGQVTLPIGSKSRLTAGLRYTIERRSVEAKGERLFNNPPFIRPIPGLPLLSEEPLRNDKTFREPSWHVSLDRDFSQSLMGYLLASRGFQSGGWNLQTPQNPPFEPETLDNFEGGLKYVDPSRRFRVNVSAFYYDYADLQVSAFTPVGSVTTNATSADVYGLDLQLEAELGSRTTLSFGAQFLEARYNQFRNATCTDYSPEADVPYAPISCDVTGNRLPFAPRLKLNVGATHHLSLGRRGTLDLSGNLAYNSGYYSEPDNVVRQEAFATVDLSANWRPIESGFSVQVWARNLTDAHYYDSLVTFPTTGVLYRPAAPRRIGMSIAYSM